MGKKKSIVTKEMDACTICGNPYIEIHHLLSGSNRAKCDEDGLTIPLCSHHHNGDTHMSVYLNPVINTWSKMFAQAVWERKWIAEHIQELQTCDSEQVLKAARVAFFERYHQYYM